MAEIMISGQFTTQGKRGASSLTSSKWKQTQPLLFVLPQGDSRWQQLKWQQKLQIISGPEGTLATCPPAICGATSHCFSLYLIATEGATVLRQLVSWGTDMEVKSPVPWLFYFISCFIIVSCFSLHWLDRIWLVPFASEVSLPALRWQLLPN